MFKRKEATPVIEGYAGDEAELARMGYKQELKLVINHHSLSLQLLVCEVASLFSRRCTIIANLILRACYNTLKTRPWPFTGELICPKLNHVPTERNNWIELWRVVFYNQRNNWHPVALPIRPCESKPCTQTNLGDYSTPRR